MADDDRAGRRVDRFLTDLGDAPVPPDLAASAANRALAQSQPGARSRQPLLVFAVGFTLLAGLTFAVLTGETPEPTVIPSAAVVDPSPSTGPLPSESTPSASPFPSTSQSEPPRDVCGEVIAVTEPRGETTQPIAVFPSKDGIAIYDITADVATALDPEFGRLPQLRTASLVTVVRQRVPSDDDHTFGQDSLFELDIATGRPQELLRLPNYVLAFEWSVDGAMLAYLVQPNADNVLCLFDTRTGTAGPLRTLSFTVGRGVNQRDERSIAWSPTAREILVGDTAQQPSLYVVDLDGRNVIEPLDGTFARWWSNNEVLLAGGLPAGGSAEVFEWSIVSIDSGRTRPFGLPSEAYRPAISADGTLIAYDDGAEEPSVFLFDVETGTSRRLARDHVMPVWLGPDLIAATAAGPCPPSNFCVIPWLESDTTVGIDPGSGERRPLALTTTLNTFSFDGTIDVAIPEGGR
jgi:hypothetical protein